MQSDAGNRRKRTLKHFVAGHAEVGGRLRTALHRFSLNCTYPTWPRKERWKKSFIAAWTAGQNQRHLWMISPAAHWHLCNLSAL